MQGRTPDGRDSTRWSVYIIRCGDRSLYTGIATDVGRRLCEHGDQTGRGAKYLRGRGPLQLVLEREVGSKGTALRVERQIKALPRARKEELIKTPAAIEVLLD